MSITERPTTGNADLLMHEYAQCNSGYNSRDLIAGELFSKVIHSFSILLALLFAINVFRYVNPNLRTLLATTVGVLGVISLGSLLLDLEGTASAKGTLRQRMRDIEQAASEAGTPRIWTLIDQRQNRYLEELVFKRLESFGPADNREKETELDIFILASRLFVLLWIVVALAIILWGGSMTISL